MIGQVLLYNFVEKLLHVAQQFLRNAFAGGVDAELDSGCSIHHCSSKHGNADGLSKTPRSGNKHFLREVVPAIVEENLAVVARKLTFGVCFPKDACTCFLRRQHICRCYYLRL